MLARLLCPRGRSPPPSRRSFLGVVRAGRGQQPADNRHLGHIRRGVEFLKREQMQVRALVPPPTPKSPTDRIHRHHHRNDPGRVRCSEPPPDLKVPQSFGGPRPDLDSTTNCPSRSCSSATDEGQERQDEKFILFFSGLRIAQKAPAADGAQTHKS